MNNIDKLFSLLLVKHPTAIGNEEFIYITCGQEFEPWGLATETWETVWSLTLCQVPIHWKSVNGLVLGYTNLPMRFSGKTLNSIIGQAVLFLEEYNQIKREDAKRRSYRKNF